MKEIKNKELTNVVEARQWTRDLNERIGGLVRRLKG
jgi:hypothetical protein